MAPFSGSFLTNPVVEDIKEDDQQEIADLAYFEGLLNEIIQRKRRIRRSPDEGQKRKVPLKEGSLESILGKSINPKSETSTRNGEIRGETVGSLLATIPGILQVHEESYNTIGHQISTVGSGLIAAINSVGEKMHQDAKEMKETMHKDMEKLEKTQHDGMHSLMSSFSDDDHNLNGLTEALHDGLDMISMKMPEKTHLEEAVHNGFDSLVESLSHRDELGSIIHNGLHDLSEQIGSKSDVSQVLELINFCL